MVRKEFSIKKIWVLMILCFVVSACSYKKDSEKFLRPKAVKDSEKKDARVEGFTHQNAGEAFDALLKKLKGNFPPQLKGYQSKTLIDGVVFASGNLERESTLEVNLVEKTAKIRVVDAPKKDGARRKSGSLTTLLSLENGKAWITQTFDADKIANWKLPVNVDGDTLKAPADQFQYLDQSEAAKKIREDDVTYNLKKRTSEAGYKETLATSYSFVFGLDSRKDSQSREIYFDREVKNVTEGETLQSENPEEDGKDELKDLKVRLAITADAKTAGEE